MRSLTPPSTGIIKPVIQPASLLARNRMASDFVLVFFSKSLERKNRQTIAHVPAGSLLLHEILIDPRLSHFVCHAATPSHWCVYHAGTHTVDSDILLTMMCGHGSRHLDNGSLGGRI